MKQNERHFDIAVVGGGPAGATAAYLLAGEGSRVALIDRCTFPRPKLCAGLLTWKTVGVLNGIFGFSIDELIRRGVILSASRRYRIFVHGKEIVRRRLDFPFHFVDRSIYDHFWVREAQDAGAKLYVGRKATMIDATRGIVELEDGIRIKADIIIGADGVWSRVRSALFPERQFKQRWRSNLAMAIEATGPPRAGRGVNAFSSLHFGHAPWGYAWCFPNPGRDIYGIGALTDQQNGTLSDAFRQFLDIIECPVDKLSGWKGHALPFGNFVTPPGVGRTLLVGDACGLADPLLGEGIYYAHRSAQLAARAVRTATASGRNPAALYERSLNRSILRELRWIKFYRNLLFWGGQRRQYRGLKLFFRLIPERLEAAVQGRISFSRLLVPGRAQPPKE